jgi:enoyl-CoA hydratase/carnithine racemase
LAYQDQKIRNVVGLPHPTKGLDLPVSPDITYTKHERFAWLRLNRPEKGNRLTPAMAEDLATACEAVENDDEVELLLLSGQGDTFCTGLEYRGSPDKQTGTAAHIIREQFGSLRCVALLGAMTKPTIAVLNGDATGIGLELALACDLRLAKAGAQFGLPHVAEGLIPFCGGTQRLPRIIGQSRALELILTGKQIDATEAHLIGLVTEVIEPDHFATRVDEVLTGLLGKGPIALRLGKEAVLKAMDLTLEQGVRLEEDLYVLLQTTHDRAEGVQAFLEKRKPVFSGN